MPVSLPMSPLETFQDPHDIDHETDYFYSIDNKTEIQSWIVS